MCFSFQSKIALGDEYLLVVDALGLHLYKMVWVGFAIS